MKQIVLLLSFSTLLFAGKALAQDVPTTEWSDFAVTTWYNATEAEYFIANAEELAGLSELVAGGNDFSGKTIQLTDAIDLGEHLWTPIGVAASMVFSGDFNGNDHVISNLYVVKPDKAFLGLFARVTDGTLSNVIIDTAYIRAKDTAGALAGSVVFDANVIDCHATGIDIFAESAGLGGAANVGGLVGELTSNSNMHRCSAQGNVVADNQVGGLVGSLFNLTGVSECYSSGTVTGKTAVGGLIGVSQNPFPPQPNRENTLNNCYSRSMVVAMEFRGGGLVGNDGGSLVIKNSYATGTVLSPEFAGGFIGYGANAVTENCYWDMTASGMGAGIGGGPLTPEDADITGKTTAEMKTQEMVDMLNAAQVSTPWAIDPVINDGYPFLGTSTVSAPFIDAPQVAVSVYPTIVVETLSISSDAGLSNYAIYSVTGQITQAGSLSGNTTEINVKGIAKGIYILVVNTDKGFATQKIVKQ